MIISDQTRQLGRGRSQRGDQKMDSHLPTVLETTTNVNPIPQKTNSTFGNWVVFGDAQFNNGFKSWQYPRKPYYFFNKKSAVNFITDHQEGNIK